MSLSQASLDVISAAQASFNKFQAKRGPFVSVSLAQYAIESAWGSKLTGTFNFFGIKANAAQIAAGQFTEKATHEQLPNGEVIATTAKFANYASLQDAFDAHATLLTSPRYIDCQNAQTPEDYCRALQKDGYATAQNYATVLIATINDNRLKQYDLPVSGNTKPAPADPPASAAGGGGGSDPAAGATTGQNQMAFNPTLDGLLKFIQDLPTATIGQAVAAGGTNIPLDIAAGKGIMDAILKDFFSGATASLSAAPATAAAAAPHTAAAIQAHVDSAS